MENLNLENITTQTLRDVAEAAKKHAAVYKTCRDGSYEACLAQYNYNAVQSELRSRDVKVI